MDELESLDQQITSLKALSSPKALKLSKKFLKLAISENNVKAQAQALRHYAMCTSSLGQLKDAEKYAVQAVELSNRQSSVKLQILCTNTYAGIMLSQGNLELASTLLKTNLKRAVTLDLIEEKAKILNNLGVIHSHLCDYPEALKYYIKSLELKRDYPNQDLRGLSQNLHNIAHTYLWLEMYQESDKYGNEALTLLEKAGELRYKAIILCNLGESAYHQKNTKAAVNYLERAISTARENGDIRELAESLILRIKCSTSDLSSTTIVKMLNEAMQLCRSSGDKKFQILAMLEFARLHLSRGECNKAMDKLQDVKSMAEENSDEDQLCELYQLISDVLAQQGNFEEAYKNILIYNKLSKKIKGANVIKKVQASIIPLEFRAIKAEAEVLTLRNQELERLNRLDHLTGLATRRYFQKQMDLTEESSEFSIIFLDIDFFKQINDHYSHSIGDNVLRLSGKILQSCCPENALAVRYGGEEFVFFLAGTKLNQAVLLAENIRCQFEEYNWTTIADELSVTVSIGVANSSEETRAEAILQLADSRLYHAKRTGRNKVIPKVNLD